MPKLKERDQAPDFTLKNQEGEDVSLSSFLEKGPVVLYFYPKDDTPGCTAEACSFRDQFEVFQEKGASIIGVSSDPVASHKKFAKRHNLPYTLLSDVSGKVRRKFGVPKTFGLLPGRVTYIIAEDGTILHIFNSQFNAKKHIDISLKVLDKI